MKLYYDKKSWNPTYFIQQGIRNGKKTTTKNVKRIGRHSELLAVCRIGATNLQGGERVEENHGKTTPFLRFLCWI